MAQLAVLTRIQESSYMTHKDDFRIALTGNFNEPQVTYCSVHQGKSVRINTNISVLPGAVIILMFACHNPVGFTANEMFVSLYDKQSVKQNRNA